MEKIYEKINYIILIILILTLMIFILYTYSENRLIYKEFIKKCKSDKLIIQDKPENIFVSICLPALNMEKYIKQALLSLIYQSFQNFEIIIVNDNSNDKTQDIIQKFQDKDKRIKLINHSKNLGVYASRANAILNALGKYVLLMDPDDMLLNQNLFQHLYYYSNYNLDIMEFLVYHKNEDQKNIIIPEKPWLNHFHNFNKDVIYQPELSDILFYVPNSKNYSQIICRTIWNKLIRKEIIKKSINYLNNDYFRNQFLIAADDTPINILVFQFAKNYSNIKVPGYLYLLRDGGMSNDNKGNIKHDIILSYNFLLYFQFFYKYIKVFKKDINFFFYDFKPFSVYLKILKEFNATKYIPKAIRFLKIIKENNDNISLAFKSHLDNLIMYFLK